VDPVSEGKAKFIAIDEQPNHQVVHLFRLGKAHRTTHSPLHPGPQIDVFALDFLRVLLPHLVLLGLDMPLVGAPPLTPGGVAARPPSDPWSPPAWVKTHGVMERVRWHLTPGVRRG